MSQTKEAPALPDKPSELLTVALDDLEVIERTPGYAVDMGVFIDARSGPCKVCLAGASLVLRCGLESPGAYIWPADMDADTAAKAKAIDHLRAGMVEDAFAELGIDDFSTADDFTRVVTPYGHDPAAFKAEIRQLAADLKAGGF